MFVFQLEEPHIKVSLIIDMGSYHSRANESDNELGCQIDTLN